jgi:predicted dehydrogenase
MLKIGIIGTGDISSLNILGYIRSQDTELVAVADVDVDCAKQKLAQWNLRTLEIYKDYKQMIDKEDLDIVEILTPHHLHAPMTEYCAKAGILGISVQKPMANSIADCEKMIEICHDEKVKLKLFENFRFYPVYLKAKELLNQGVIGEPLNFRINTIAPAGPSWPVPLKAHIWRINVDKCGGGPWIYDDGQHKLSIALWLMDQERVEKVYSWIDYFTGVMDAPANIFWKYPSKNPDDPPKFGTMEFSLASNLYYPSNYYNCDEFIEISGTKGIMWINQCTSGGNFLSKSSQYPPITVYTDGEVKKYGEDLPRDWRHSFINSTEHFINVIKNRQGEPIYTGEQGKNLCIFGKMPYISDQRRETVYWDDMTAENESKGFCAIQKCEDAEQGGMAKYFSRKNKDMRKAIKQGLSHKKLEYYYENC